MKNSSKRTISRILALVMMVTCSFANIIVTNAKVSDIYSDSVVSGPAVNTVYKWSADNMAVETFSANPSLDGEIFSYSIISGKSKVTTNTKTFEDGSYFDQRLQMGGNGKIADNSGVFTIEAPSAGQLYVYAVTSKNTEGRAVQFYDANDLTTPLDSDTSGPITDASTYSYPVFVYDVPAAGTYKVTSNSSVNFYGMAFAAAEDETTTAEAIETTTAEDTETTTADAAETTTADSTETTTAAPSGGDTTLGTPVQGKTYALDLKTLTVGDKLNGVKSADGTVMIVSPEDKAYVHDGTHGAALYNGDQIQVAVAGDADITFALCQYSKGTEFAVTDANGTALGTVAAVGATDTDTAVFSYKGEATTLTFTLAAAGEAYLHSVTSSNMLPPLGDAQNFEIWLDDIATDVAGVKTIEPGRIAADQTLDSELTLIANGTTKYTNTEYAASMGQTYPNKEGTHDAYKAGARSPQCSGTGIFSTLPVEGEGTCVVFKPAATGTFVVYFYSTSFLRVLDFENGGDCVGYSDSEVAPFTYAYKAVAGHTYVMTTTGKTNNMAYAGFEYMVDEPTTIGVDLNNVDADPASIPTLEVYLTDVNLGTVEATVKADTTSVDLAKGHTYKLSTNDGGVDAMVNGSYIFKAGVDPITIDLTNIPDEILSGEITGTPEGTVTGLKFTNMVNGAEFEATITGSTYTCVMKPGDYNTSVTTTNGGVTYDRVKVVSDGVEDKNEVYVEVQDITKGVTYDLPTEVAKASSLLALNNISANNSTSVKAVAGSSIVVPVTGKQVVTVAGWYAGTWDINGQNSVTTDSSANASSPTTTTYFTDGTETSVTVNVTGEGANYLYWIDVQNVVDFKSELTVPGDYATLTEAVKAIKAMDRPADEAGRVTINLAADIQEQVLIDTPYVKINGNGHTISWYYGVGTFYYSVDSKGYYNERLFRDKYSSNEASGSLWGGTVIVTGDYFLAEDTTFKNTYNYEVTDKEILDFAKTATSSFPQRTSKNVDVQTYAAKERCNALYVDGNFLECYNCNILGSQDTLGANKGTDYFAYFKDCTIGGNTDFICGAGNMVFDNCNLQIKSLTQDTSGDNAKLIGPTAREAQYVFRNCNWTVDTTANGPVSIKFGRTWQNNSHCAFINTETNGLIHSDGWGQMSAGQLDTAQFIEYNNYSKGIPMEVTPWGNVADYGDSKNPNPANFVKMTDEEVAAIVANLMDDTYTIGTVLGGWTPVHYAQLDNEFTTEATTEEVFFPVEDNGFEYEAGNETRDIIYAGSTIYEDNRVEIIASQNLGHNTEDAAVTIDESRTYAQNLTSTGANTIITVNGIGDTPAAKTYRIHNQITAKEDVQIVIDQKIGGGKINAVIKNLASAGPNASGTETFTADLVTMISNTGSDSLYDKMVIDLKAGETVYFAGQGTNPSVYGFDVIGGTTLVDSGYDYAAINEPADKATVFKDDIIYEDSRVLVKAEQNLGVNTEAPAITIDESRTYDRNLTSTGTNTIITVNGIGETPAAKTYRIHHSYTAKQDITVTLDEKVGAGKINAVIKNIVSAGLNAAGTETFTADLVTMCDNTADSKNSLYNTMTFTIKAGETVYFAGQGTNPSIYAFDITSGIAGGSDDPTETTTATTTTEVTTTTTTEITTTTTTTTQPDNPDKPIAKALWGDVNDNNAVDAGDAALTLQYVLNNATVLVVERADVSGNGVIDSEDAAMILQKALDSTYTFPVEGTDVPDPSGSTPVLYVVGDSTGCHYSETEDPNYYYKRVGFGDKIADYADLEVVNLAISGRSSKSFLAEANYETLKSSIKEGDILLIAFGHNDEKADDAARYTFPSTADAPTTKDTEGSFKNSLYVNYVKLAQDAGATPILCSPIVRRTESGTWSGNSLHIANNGDYAADVKDLAAEVNVPFIDLTQITKAKYDELTPANTVNLHAWTNSASTSCDNTHLNNYGAKEVAYLIATNAPAELAPYIKAGIAEPTTADLVVNPNYVEESGEDLKGDALNSILWTTTAPWHGTVFGNLGGESKLFSMNADGTMDYTKLAETNGVTNFAITENVDGSVNLRAGHRKEDNITPNGSTGSLGKIEGSSDGIVMYYQPVDVAQNFSISATAHVNGVHNTYSQVAFGAIIADNIKVDVNDKILIHNYVAASPLKMSAAVGTVNETTGELTTAWGGYARINDTLTKGATIDSAEKLPKPGDDIFVKITKVGNVYTVEYGEYTSTFTVDMTDQAYVGFFVARCADVTFSNINFNNEVTE